MSIKTTMQGAEAPSQKGSGGTYDHNTSSGFSKPHSTGGGGIPLKFYENIPATPAPLVSTLEDKNNIAK